VVSGYPMAQPRCSVCLHSKKSDIDAALMAGGTLIPTGQRFGVSKSALARHRTGCLAPKVAAAAKMVAPASATRAEVGRAKAIASGTVQPVPDDILSLTGLLGRLARSLERLESAADTSLADNIPTALAAVSGQLHRGIETAAKMQGLYVEPVQPAAPTFSIIFNLDATEPPPVAARRSALALRDADGGEHAVTIMGGTSGGLRVDPTPAAPNDPSPLPSEPAFNVWIAT
jgi:hypothetical protein